MKSAKAQGNTNLVAQIQQQIQQLQQSVQQYSSSLLQAQVEYFTTQAQYETNALQRRSSFATNVVAKGVQGFGGVAQTLAAQMQLNVLKDTGGELQSQLSRARGLYASAEEQGNVQLAQQLLDQIGTLQESIVENTQAVSDQTVVVRQASIDQITRSSGFQTGVFGSLYGALQTMGQLTGGLDVKTALGVTNANQNVLQGSLGGYLGALSSGYGIDLTSLASNPTGLIQALGSINYPQVEAGMTQAQVTQFEGLITSISQNIGALEQNTVQLQTLNGQLNQPQGWSTTAWQTFRSAIFTGMGGLLPQFSSIPHMADGGRVLREGLAYLHAAEVVTPAKHSAGDTHFHVPVAQAPVYQVEPQHLARSLAWAWKNRT
jgi:hypothetical protein